MTLAFIQLVQGRFKERSGANQESLSQPPFSKGWQVRILKIFYTKFSAPRQNYRDSV